MVSFPTVSERFQSIMSEKPRVAFNESTLRCSEFAPYVERVPITGAYIETLPFRHASDADCREQRAYFEPLRFRVLAIKEKFFRSVSVN